MDDRFFCEACGTEHSDPAEALLGYRVTCLDCALSFELNEGWAAAVAAFDPPIAA